MQKKFEWYGNYDYNKQSIYIDIDDVILKSSETIVNIINKKYNITPQKNTDDIKDYELKSIYKKIEAKDIENIFDSKEFWDEIEINPTFLNWLSEKDFWLSYNWIFFTKGRIVNLTYKFNLLSDIFEKNNLHSQFSFIGIHNSEKKQSIKMLNGIQIDDNINNLINSDAKIKILLKNHRNTNYNNYDQINTEIENLYVVDDIKQVEDILKFNINNQL